MTTFAHCDCLRVLYRAVRKTASEWGWLSEKRRLWRKFASFFSITESYLIRLVMWVCLWWLCIYWMMTLLLQVSSALMDFGSMHFLWISTGSWMYAILSNNNLHILWFSFTASTSHSFLCMYWPNCKPEGSLFSAEFVCLSVCLSVSDRHFYPSTLTDFDKTWSQGPYSDLVWPRP